MLQKKQNEVDNQALKLKQLMDLGRDDRGMYSKIINAQEQLQKFLSGYASHVTAADITTPEDDEAQMQTVVEMLTKENSEAELHLKGVRSCLKEAEKA